MLHWLVIAATAVAMVGSPFMACAIAAEPAQPVLPANLRTVNLWMRVLGTAKLPEPWRAAPCDTKAPLLCVYHQGTFVGTLEMGTYLVGSRADLRKKLTEAGVPAKANAADPKYRSQLEKALKAWVADYYAFFKQDRESVYGKQITFTTQIPSRVPIGKLMGLRYGFAGVKQDSNIHEKRLGYVAFDGTTLYIITTAFDTMSETGKFKTLEDFQRFEPYLTKLVAGLQLPIAQPTVRR
ncbi:hypothetical protein [Stenomitos frigidus]|uniref:Uncharacterized protein n=1 Tax=Stenomitos frigidus ULC18 TaxID=2107698 RepID=A0A2T1EKY8_9CYAN|nr:hypothetical protein [Stenomitos frigidus]PSB33420.1 hypothetical protein C7B82_04555 [Stenomitos frigidus ULC18]